MDSDERQAFHEFVAAERLALLRTAYLLTGNRDDAEDLVQSTLVRLHESWHRIERRDVPSLYARRVMINLNMSIWRRVGRRERVTGAPPERPVADQTAAYDARDELVRACLTLPPRQRAVLVVRYFEDMSEAEAARALGISVGAVKSQTSRALARLRDVLDPSPPRDEETGGARRGHGRPRSTDSVASSTVDRSAP